MKNSLAFADSYEFLDSDVSYSGPSKHRAAEFRDGAIRNFWYQKLEPSYDMFESTAAAIVKAESTTSEAVDRHVVAPAAKQQDRFVPSQRLISLVFDGIEYYSRSSGDRAGSVWIDPRNRANVEAEFTHRLYGMIVRQMHLLRGDEAVSILFLTNAGLLPDLEDRLVDEFPIRPRKTGMFLNELCDELRAFFAMGGIIKGDWGTIILAEGQVCAELNADEVVDLPIVNVEILDVKL
jgi:hypothetical protein